MLATAAAFGEAGNALRAVGKDEPRVAREIRQPASIRNDERNLLHAYDRAGLRDAGPVRAQSLTQRYERRLGLAAEHRSYAERTQQSLVHRRIEAVDAKSRPSGRGS